MASAAEPREDWALVLDRMMKGDRAAFIKLSGLVTGFLSHWRAFDFRDDWEDLVHETLTAVVDSVQKQRIREPKAVVGYIRQVAHNKFQDRLRRHLRTSEDQTLPWEEVFEQSEVGAPAVAPEFVLEVRELVARLPEEQAKAVLGVYAYGRTYEQVAKDTGVSLGTLKRRLRDGLERLREEVSDGFF